MLGKLECIELNSPELEQELSIRFRSEIGVLGHEGFRWLCACGESFPVFRLLLIFPALITLLMLFKREVIRMRGPQLMMCYPVLVSSDRTTLAAAFGLGVKFYTTFDDGSALISTTLAGRDMDGAGITKRYYSAGIHQVWARHQEGILELTGHGKQPDRQFDLRNYIKISPIENELARRS